MKLNTLILLVLLPFFGCSQNKNPTKKENNSVKLVELFTSEGCSSCPPADKLVEELQDKNLENVIILAFHVDYWDRLGWKDTFSQSKFSDRQRWYSNIFKLNSIYTPQIIVNGQKQFVGSERNLLYNSLEKENIVSGGKDEIQVKILDFKNGEISLEYNLERIDDSAILNFALVQNQAITKVKRGENSNRTLSHVDIMREFKSISPEKYGKLSLKNDDLNPSEFHVVAFLQDKKSGEILGATQIQVLK